MTFAAWSRGSARISGPGWHEHTSTRMGGRAVTGERCSLETLLASGRFVTEWPVPDHPIPPSPPVMDQAKRPTTARDTRLLLRRVALLDQQDVVLFMRRRDSGHESNRWSERQGQTFWIPGPTNWNVPMSSQVSAS